MTYVIPILEIGVESHFTVLMPIHDFHETEVRQKWEAGPNRVGASSNTYSHRQEGRERLVEVIYEHGIGARK